MQALINGQGGITLPVYIPRLINGQGGISSFTRWKSVGRVEKISENNKRACLLITELSVFNTLLTFNSNQCIYSILCGYSIVQIRGHFGM